MILKIERQKRPDYISYHLMRLIRKFPVPEMLPRVFGMLAIPFFRMPYTDKLYDEGKDIS